MDKITITRKQFDRWFDAEDSDPDDPEIRKELYWELLCEEAAKPEAKKLFAIRELETGAITFTEKDVSFYQSSSISLKRFERAPEFDIEYPEEKKYL